MKQKTKEQQVTAESFFEWTRRQPFEPFLIRVSNGNEYAIRHPDMVIPTIDYVNIAIPSDPSTGRQGYAKTTWVSMLHVVEIVPLDAPSKPKKTRQGKR
jgi:hypothetical protein